jgi:hypothetical protein
LLKTSFFLKFSSITKDFCLTFTQTLTYSEKPNLFVAFNKVRVWNQSLTLKGTRKIFWRVSCYFVENADTVDLVFLKIMRALFM